MPSIEARLGRLEAAQPEAPIRYVFSTSGEIPPGLPPDVCVIRWLTPAEAAEQARTARRQWDEERRDDGR